MSWNKVFVEKKLLGTLCLFCASDMFSVLNTVTNNSITYIMAYTDPSLHSLSKSFKKRANIFNSSLILLSDLWVNQFIKMINVNY